MSSAKHNYNSKNVRGRISTEIKENRNGTDQRNRQTKPILPRTGAATQGSRNWFFGRWTVSRGAVHWRTRGRGAVSVDASVHAIHAAASWLSVGTRKQTRSCRAFQTLACNNGWVNKQRISLAGIDSAAIDGPGFACINNGNRTTVASATDHRNG